MNIKIRFALLFTSFVTLILSVSAVAIYFLYSNFRVQEFYSRLNKEATRSYNLHASGQIELDKNDHIKKDNEYALIDLAVIIYDTLDRPILAYPDSITYRPPSNALKKAKSLNEYKYVNGNRECLIVYIPETDHFVFASALDKYGLRKLKNIQLILVGVLFGGVLLAVFISFIFVKQAFKPLQKLSNQMLQTTEPSMAKAVIVTNKNDEISQIALSYNSMIERLKDVFEHQKSFVNHASHELRTPLAIMLSQTEAALNNNLDCGDLRNVLVSLKEDIQDIIQLTNSLLFLSLYEKKPDNTWETFRIDEAIYDSVDVIKSAFPNALISFGFGNVPQEEDLMITANKALIETAIKNLIKNGYQYSSDNQVKINLFVNKTSVEITVVNNGEEVSESERPKLFIPFFRANNADKQKGHGLGLSIVQRIAQIHGGTIVYSTYGNNRNCFTITLQKQKPVE